MSLDGTQISEWALQFVLEFGWAAIKIGLAMLVGWLLHLVVFRTARQMCKKSRWSVDGAVLQAVRRSSRLLLVLLAVLGVSYNLPAIAEPQLVVMRHALNLAIIAIAMHSLLRALTAIEKDVKGRHAINVRDNYMARRVHTQVTVLRRAIAVFVVVVGLALMFMTFPRARELGASLLASAGLFGIIVGLAARPILENLIAGLQIALTQPINIDDVVIVEGEWGCIEEISSTYVVVRIWDQRRLIVPLAKFIQEPFQNWTRRNSDILGTIFIHADYSVPVQAVRDELQRIVESSDKWDGKVCVLQVTNASERTVELRALVSAANSSDAWDLRVFVREKLIEFLQTQFPDVLPKSRIELAGHFPSGAEAIADKSARQHKAA